MTAERIGSFVGFLIIASLHVAMWMAPVSDGMIHNLNIFIAYVMSILMIGTGAVIIKTGTFPPVSYPSRFEKWTLNGFRWSSGLLVIWFAMHGLTLLAALTLIGALINTGILMMRTFLPTSNGA